MKIVEPVKHCEMEEDCNEVSKNNNVVEVTPTNGSIISSNSDIFVKVNDQNINAENDSNNDLSQTNKNCEAASKKSSPILEGLISGRNDSPPSVTSDHSQRQPLCVEPAEDNETRKKKTDTFVCIECEDQFHFVEDLEEHLMVLHRDQRIYKCITCKAKFLDQAVLHAHLSNCSGKFLYLCFHCGEDFIYISQYESHIESHSGENLFHNNKDAIGPLFFTLCFQCGEEFMDREEYDIHLDSHKSKKTHHCDFCLQSFCNSDEYEQHLESCYQPPDASSSINGTYECIDCGESFNNYTKFAEHQKLHETSCFFICKCEAKFSTNLSLKCHVQDEADENSHVEIKSFHCEFCNKTFSHTGHYKRHLLSHNLKKKFPCEECGKVFDRQCYLDVHTRLHSGDRPFVCECGKSFVAKKRLNRHKKIHIKDSLIKCAQCGKGFTELSRLKCHMKTHSGLRPFTCEICNHSFTRSNHLKRHMTIHERAKIVGDKTDLLLKSVKIKVPVEAADGTKSTDVEVEVPA